MDLNKIAFEIISNAGDSFSMTMEALASARENDFSKAESLLEKSKASLIEAHKTHSELLFYFANGKMPDVNILLVHAQDHLTKAESTIILADEILALYRKIKGE